MKINSLVKESEVTPCNPHGKKNIIYSWVDIKKYINQAVETNNRKHEIGYHSIPNITCLPLRARSSNTGGERHR